MERLRSPVSDVHHRDLDGSFLPVPFYGERHLVSHADALELAGQISKPLDRLAVYANDHVAELSRIWVHAAEAGLLRR